ADDTRGLQLVDEARVLPAAVRCLSVDPVQVALRHAPFNEALRQPPDVAIRILRAAIADDEKSYPVRSPRTDPWPPVDRGSNHLDPFCYLWGHVSCVVVPDDG